MTDNEYKIKQEFYGFYYHRIKPLAVIGLVTLSVNLMLSLVFKIAPHSILLPAYILCACIYVSGFLLAHKKKFHPDVLFNIFVLCSISITVFGFCLSDNSFKLYTLVLILLLYIFVPASRPNILIGGSANLIAVVSMIFFINPTLFPQVEKWYILTTNCIIFLIIYYFGLFNRRTILSNFEQKIAVEDERQKSDSLLLNILPRQIVQELKEKGHSDSKTYTNVCIFFSDMAGFTDLSRHLEPKYLIDALSEIFSEFDTIMEQHHCERIKTIGDAYLAVAGMSGSAANPSVNMISAAGDIIKYLRERNQHTQIKWYVRVGVHTGTIVGGIVGHKKYLYDIFGSDVNIASRMESNGEKMKINCSERTYELCKDSFNFTQRDISEVKGIGKMKMYYLKEDS